MDNDSTDDTRAVAERVVADPRWVAAIKETFDAHPEIGCVGGRIEVRWSSHPPPWLTPLCWGPVALQAEKGRTPYVDAENAAPCLMTANFACRRAALEEVGGFSPDFLRDKDREPHLRLWAAGKRGMYVGALAVTTEVPEERPTEAVLRQLHPRATSRETAHVMGRPARADPLHAGRLPQSPRHAGRRAAHLRGHLRAHNRATPVSLKP